MPGHAEFKSRKAEPNQCLSNKPHVLLIQLGHQNPTEQVPKRQICHGLTNLGERYSVVTQPTRAV